MNENEQQKRKKGRPNLYCTRIFPNMDKIEKQLKNGATETQVAHNIGVSVSVWKSHKRNQEYFRNKCFHAREALVQELRGKLVSKAMGFEYKETEITERTEKKGTETITKTTIKQALPDVAALNLALKARPHKRRLKSKRIQDKIET